MLESHLSVLKERVVIFAGAYGSGKTEVAVNYALHLAALRTNPVSIADLDVINPYFRSREAALALEARGVSVIIPPGEMRHADLPVILPQIRGEIENSAGKVILDVGGDDVGSRVLGSLADSLSRCGCDLLLVLNARRPFTSDVDGSLKMMRAIEASSRLQFTAIVSNTHLIGETTADIVDEGYRLAEEVGCRTGIPVAFVSVAGEAGGRNGSSFIKAPVFRLTRQLLKPWEEKAGFGIESRFSGGLTLCRV